jgi:integrase
MVEGLRPPKRGRLVLSDATVPGLVLRVTPRGRKAWSVIYRRPGLGPAGRAGPQVRETIGTHPAMSLEDARAKATEVLAGARSGAAEAAPTLASVAPTFLAEHKRTVSTWSRGELTLRLHVLPKLGSRPVAEVTRADVHRLLDELVSAGKPGAAREVRKILSKLFNWLLDRELAERNPATALRRADLRANKDAGRSLADAELRVVWRAAVRMGYPFGDLARVLLLTGCRLSEWAAATWSEVDQRGRALAIPPGRHKSRRGLRVPLSAAAWAIVSALPRWNEGDHLFSTTAGRRPVSGFGGAADKLRALAAEENGGEALAHYRWHDFRVTFRSRLAELRVPGDVAELAVGHARVGLERVYVKADLADEVRRAMELYGQHLLEVVGGG